jgi:hypothetical protein
MGGKETSWIRTEFRKNSPFPLARFLARDLRPERDLIPLLKRIGLRKTTLDWLTGKLNLSSLLVKIPKNREIACHLTDSCDNDYGGHHNGIRSSRKSFYCSEHRGKNLRYSQNMHIRYIPDKKREQ